MTQYISNAHLYRSIKAALKNKTLGALKKRTKGKYLYADGAKCAIGCALNKSTLKKVLCKEKEMSYYLDVTSLEGIIDVQNLDLAEDLQQYHDQWARRNPGYTKEGFLELLEKLKA